MGGLRLPLPAAKDWRYSMIRWGELRAASVVLGADRMSIGGLPQLRLERATRCTYLIWVCPGALNCLATCSLPGC